ncbi:hypothetical protein [Desulfovibrio subterraneus]|uniref:Uncharacterized protein n=1 Tax=Desulfovibrio subterraneus TaxID=2718620 RepID=A0A7J0BGW2_9BACT|nr:hypothetical protein [Desulfovibrio subterraneus]GFM32422.1 hypothetical protein DSM101010T_07870 [Desulfovibrio subterraneus]
MSLKAYKTTIKQCALYGDGDSTTRIDFDLVAEKFEKEYRHFK